MRACACVCVCVIVQGRAHVQAGTLQDMTECHLSSLSDADTVGQIVWFFSPADKAENKRETEKKDSGSKEKRGALAQFIMIDSQTDGQTERQTESVGLTDRR